jgi:Rrf2 family protein
MRIPLKADYAIRALAELAAAPVGEWLKAEHIAARQEISTRFLLNIFTELRHTGIVRSQRGKEGGYRLGRSPETISLAEILRAIDGPLASVGNHRPEELRYYGAASPLQDVWIAVRVNLRQVLEHVTLKDISTGCLPEHVERLTGTAGAWDPH